jgi:hypothetical protein
MSQQIGQFVIKLGADNAELISQMERAKKQVRSYGKDAKTAADINSKMSKGFQEAANNTAIFLGPLNSVSGHLSSVAAGISRVGVAQLAMTAGVTGTIFALKKGLDTYEQWETSQLSNEQLLKSTGYAAGYNAEQIQALSESVAMNTLASVEGAQKALGSLVTFKSIAQENIAPAIAIAQDMAQVFGQDLKSSAVQLGKALEDPVKGINALKRVGVSFTATQQEQIKHFVETNNLAKAQATVLSVLQGQMGGSGQAAAKGLAGSWDTLGQQWDTLMVRLAKRSGLADASKMIINNIGVGVGELAEKLRETEAATRSSQLGQSYLDLHFQILAAKDSLKEYQDIQNQPDKLREKYGDRFDITKAMEVVEARILSLEKQKLNVSEEQQQVLVKLNQEREAAAKIYKQGEETRKMIEKEAAEERAALAKEELEKQQANGSRKLQSLESQVLSEEDKARTSYDKRLEDLDQMKLSEVEINKRGFENINDLRTYYKELAREQLIDDLNAVDEKNQREIDQERNKLAAINSSREESNQFLTQWYEQQKEILAQHRISEQELEAGGFETKLEARAYYEEMLRLSYDERLAFIEEHNQKEIDAETRKWETMNRAQTKNAKQRASLEQNIATTSLNILASSSDQGSGIWMAAILAQQGMLAAQAVMQSQLLATQTTAAQMPAPGTDVTGVLTAKAVAAGETVRGWGMLNAALIMAQGVGQIAGAREFGGPVIGGYNYLVGENGPEVVSFGQSGTVHPNRSLDGFMNGGGGIGPVTIYQTIDARGADEGAEARMLAAGDKLVDAAYQKVLTDAKNSGPIRRELGR